jgi:hypothetical protein
VLPLPNVIRRRWRPVEDRNDVTVSAMSWGDHVTPVGAGHASIGAESALGASSRPHPPWMGRCTVLRSLAARSSRRHPSPARRRMAITNDRVARVAVTVAMVALIASGCSSSGVHTNGLEKKSATQVHQAAVAALKAAKSVHVTWTGRDERKTGRLDMRTQGNASTGTMGLPGANIGLPGVVELQITTIGRDLYVKTDRRGSQLLGAIGAPAAMQNLAGRWVKFRKDQVNLEGPFSLDELAADLATLKSPLEPKVEQTTVAGKKVVVLSAQDGSKLYVANIGPAYPLRVERGGTATGRFDYTEYGADFHITAPSDAVEAPTAASGTETVPAPPASGSSTPPGNIPGTLKIGQAAIITIDGTEAASLTIASVQTSTRPADEYGSAPQYGYFLTVQVRAMAVASYRNGFDIGPIDFYALVGSSHFEEGNGNALDAPGADRELDYATLNAGEATSGTLVFDVPAKHGKIAYSPEFEGGPLGYWTF